MIRSGQLRHLVTLQKPVKNTASDGERISIFVDVDDVRAKVYFSRGREFIKNKEQRADIVATVTIRYRSDVTRAWRVMFGDRELDIVHVVDVGDRQRELELMCREELHD